MARWLVAFVLAFAVAGGPVLADICDTSCTNHPSHSPVSTSEVSHHHHETPSSANLALSGETGNSCCNHADAETTDVRQVNRATGVAKATLAASGTLAIPIRCGAPGDFSRRSEPPPLKRTSSQLRI